MKFNTLKYINLFLAISTIIIIFNFYEFVVEKSTMQYSDWHYYQGGFVRRGLPGEIFYQLYNLTKIPLDLIVFVFVSSFYVLFGIFL